jgi:hypothetical protein
MLAGGSVGGGWDHLERAGPKDDRQATVGSERWSKTNMEETHCENAMESQHCEDAKSLHEEMATDFLVRWHISRMTEQDRQVSRPDMVIDADDIAQTCTHTQSILQLQRSGSVQRLSLQLTRGRARLRHTRQFFRGMLLAVGTQCCPCCCPMTAYKALPQSSGV